MFQIKPEFNRLKDHTRFASYSNSLEDFNILEMMQQKNLYAHLYIFIKLSKHVVFGY